MIPPIRLCTWNIQLGSQLDRIIAAIHEQRDFAALDLLALQEASLHEGQEDARAIAAALGPEYDSYQVTAHMLDGRVQANALVWNTASVQVSHRDCVKLPLLREVHVSRTERTLLRALPLQQRISVVVEGFVGEQSLRVYVAHLDVVGFGHKREQFLRILDDMRGKGAVQLTILAGDLNTFKFRARPSWAQLLAAAEAEGLQELTREIRWTHSVPRLRMKQKLDAIFVGGARPLRHRTWSLDIRGSDHIPVFAELRSDEQ